MSIAGGLYKAVERAHAIGCSAMQLFSHNPRGWRTSPIGADEAELFRTLSEDLDVRPAFIHTSYLINLASPRDDLREKSLLMLRDEMLRAHTIGAEYVVLHPGTAHDGQGAQRAAQSIRKALEGVETSATLLIENTSGKRGDFSSTVENLAQIMEGSGGLVGGVCIDSCHAYAAGYDLAGPEGVDTLAGEVERHMGRDAVKLLHLNDSKGLLGSGTDRHDHLGQGRIGLKGLGLFVNHKVFAHAPVIIETPWDTDDDDRNNLAKLSAML